MTVLKCVNKKDLHKFGAMNFPIIGAVEFDKEEKIKVDDKLVEQFLAIKTGHEFHVINSKGEDETQVKLDEAKKNDPRIAQKEAYAAELKSLNLIELNLLFNSHPEKERIGIRKAVDKITYLVKKQFPE